MVLVANRSYESYRSDRHFLDIDNDKRNQLVRFYDVLNIVNLIRSETYNLRVVNCDVIENFTLNYWKQTKTHFINKQDKIVNS
jgi:hypothetical protein